MVFVEIADRERQALGVALNRTSDLAEIDEAKLGELLESIRDDGMTELLEAMAYTSREADKLIEVAAHTRGGGVGWEEALGALPGGDGSGFQQMTFTVSDGQAATVKAAVDKAKAGQTPGGENKNSNGNALAALAESYLGQS